MKTQLAILILIILVILFYIAWKKETIQVDREMPTFERPERLEEKAPKSKAPNSKEEKCRDIFERLTGRAYPTIRPNWLKNPETGRKLELDGFCADLRSAFEYNGKQHYEYPNAFHKTKEDFEKLVKRDEIKLQTCSSHGINLLVIPYYLEEFQLEPFISSHLREIGLL